MGGQDLILGDPSLNNQNMTRKYLKKANYSFIAFITGMLLTVFSCIEENYDIAGKVLDVHTKASIPHRKIIVQAMVKSGNKDIPVYNGEFSTDSSGCFTYAMKKIENVTSYNFCVIGDSAYAYSNTELDLTELKRYGRFLCFNLNKLTDITITIDSKSSIPVDDEVLYLSWKSDGIDGKILYPYKLKNHSFTSSNSVLKWTGGDIKSEIKTKVFADKKTIVRWEIFRNGKMKVVTDTIFCMRDVANYIRFEY
jgi:hypothetical protein